MSNIMFNELFYIYRKVAGSILDYVIVFFNWPNPSNGTVVMGSTGTLTEMSTRNFPEGKGRKADA
jgi:hypothetical protein